VSCVPL